MPHKQSVFSLNIKTRAEYKVLSSNINFSNTEKFDYHYYFTYLLSIILYLHYPLYKADYNANSSETRNLLETQSF